jgi:O-glycosyl hydrolase
MKTIIALLTTTMLVAGATSAMAYDRQATDDALSSASVQTSHGFGGAFASARAPGEARNSTVNAPTQDDFQLDGR